MQKHHFKIFLLFSLFFFVTAALALEDPLRPIRQLVNQIYRSSQDMVTHGSDGHIDEIVLYGKKMVERAERLLEEVEDIAPEKFNNKKKKIIASIKSTLKKAREAVKLGEENKGKISLLAARKASFQAKQLRQRLLSIR